MKPSKITTALLAAVCGVTVAAQAEETPLPPASTKANLTYAADIKPIFDANCVKCHSGDKPKARLRLDTLDGILAGAKQGKIITAGDGAKSLVVKAIAHQIKDKDGWMPPMPNRAGAKTLTPEEIGLVLAWINQGAK